MTKTEIAHLLTLCAAFDYRTIGETDVLAWHQALGDLPLDDAKTAVVEHYRTSTDRIQVAHIYAHVRRLRRDRLRHADATFQPSPFAAINPTQYTTEYRDHCRAVADGVHPVARKLACGQADQAVPSSIDPRTKAVVGQFLRHRGVKKSEAA